MHGYGHASAQQGGTLTTNPDLLTAPEIPKLQKLAVCPLSHSYSQYAPFCLPEEIKLKGNDIWLRLYVKWKLLVLHSTVR